MEIAGLAIGVAGLSGLFSACLEVIERAASYNDFGRDSHYLATQFKAEKLRVEQWGRAVGLTQQGLEPDHHPALDNAEVLSSVEELLILIQEIGSDTSRALPSNPRQGNVNHGEKGPAPPSQASAQPGASASRRQKLGWALVGKDRGKAQLEKFTTLISLLHGLVPAHQPRDVIFKSGTSTTNSSTYQSSLVAEIQRVLLQIDERIQSEEKEGVSRWLGSYSSRDLYEDAIRRRVDGTCDWVLERPVFQDWMSPDTSEGTAKLLWIHGPAGYGKTVLCANVVEHLLSTSETPVAHFFLSSESEGRDDPYVAMRSWIAQVISQDQRAFDAVCETWRDQSEQHASRATVAKLFQEVVQATPNCIFVLDGLDECTQIGQSAPRSGTVVDFLDCAVNAVADNSARLLVVSREESDIQRALGRGGCVELKISATDVGPDISEYARSIVNKRLSKKDESTRDDLARRMAYRCDGQFLWLRMHEESLRASKNKKQLEAIINEAPSGLERLYERNGSRILRLPDRDRSRAVSLLRWAAFALRPLTVEEITEAVLVDDARADFPVEEMPDEIDDDYINDEVLGLCGSLLEVRDASTSPRAGHRTVHVPHFSVKQYIINNLLPQGSFFSINADLMNSYEASMSIKLAELCLIYLGYQRSWGNELEGSDNLQGTAFRDYAAVSWPQHAAKVNEQNVKLVKLMMSLFDERNPLWDRWARWYDNIDDGGEKPAKPLYFASRLGLNILVKSLAQTSKFEIDERTMFGETALFTACARGNKEVVETLLEANASLQTRDDAGRTPVYTASLHGHIDVLKLLLDKGADITTPGNNGATPFYAAANHGRTEVVRLLLGSVDIATPFNGWTPLNGASDNGHTEVVKLLLDNGADTTIRNSQGWTPLHSASRSGHVEVVKLLLDKGTDTEIRDYGGRAPLHSASLSGHVEVVKLLLDKATDTGIQDYDGWTPLNSASRNGHVEVVQLLLDRDADITIPENDGWTPLNSASNNNHIEIVKLLLDKGADTGIRDNDGWTPVNAASWDGHAQVVKLLLDKGADMTIPDKEGWTPLNVAAYNGHVEVVQLLLDRGADTTVPEDDGWTPLISASNNNHVEAVKLLLDRGADTTSSNREGRTPLHIASWRGHLEVARLLAQPARHQPGRRDHLGRTPLLLAAVQGHSAVVEMLISNDPSEITAPDHYGLTPLFVAAKEGHTDVVKLLLPAEANPNELEDAFGRTLQWWARKPGGHETTSANDKRLGWCDACLCAIYGGTSYYECEVCNAGNFWMCTECFDMDLKCLDSSHVLCRRA